MKRTLLVGFSILLLAAASGCAAASGGEATPPPPDAPVSSDDPTPTPTAVPAPGEVEFFDAPVDSFDILFLESFPLQVNVAVQGTFGDGCSAIAETASERTGNTFSVRLTASRPVGQMCTEALVPYQQVIPLDVNGLPSGTYTVDVNGLTDTFTFEADNALPTEPDGGIGDSGGEMAFDLAVVTDVEVAVSGNWPTPPQIIIRGYLNDACTEINAISDRLDGGAIRVAVETRRPKELLCAQVIQDFEIQHTLTSVPGPGTYTLDVNGVPAQLTVR